MNKFVLLLLLFAIGSVSAGAQTTPPNIVVILADDLGYGDIGFNGCPDIPTPNIDSIAANGVLCTNGYSTHPFCSPSRAGLLTGRYQQRFGHEMQPTDDGSNPLLGLPAQELVLPQILKSAGYVSGIVGKWHLGQAPNLRPLERGFDEFFGFLRAKASPGYYNAEVFRDETPLIEPEYLTDAFTREAISFINRHASRPFFLYLAYNAVHGPFDPPPQVYLDRVGNISDPNRRNYGGMVVALDVGVGKVLRTLQTNNLLDNTLIFFLSDNGAYNTGFTSNAPLRGWKFQMWEGGIRVPFAVQWTGRLPAHSVYDDPVSALDIVATAAAAAGVPLPTDRVYDGLDIVPYLAGEAVAPVRTLYWRWFGLGSAGPTGSVDTTWAVRNGSLKLVRERTKTDQPPALFDLNDDIHEDNNLASSRPEDVAALQSLYSKWTLDTVPPLWQQGTQFNSLPQVLAGDWNGFDKDDTSPIWRLTRVTAPGPGAAPDGFNWFTTTVHVAASGGDTTPGDHSFVLVGARTYASQWGGVTIKIDDATTLPFFSGGTLGPLNHITFDNGYYYSFRILDPVVPAPIDLSLAVMKTSAPPISASRTEQIPAVPKPSDQITVKIATSQAKSSEERIYLRWSTDTFITSTLVEATGSGVSYSATIPAQLAGTLLQYSIVTSTADLTHFTTSGEIDSRILATSATFNAFVPVLPSITTQPADRLVLVGQKAKFFVVAGGTKPFGYQWTKNGTNISGATSASYVTPPNTLTDNGAVFAVTINNRAGRVISKNAALTVK